MHQRLADKILADRLPLAVDRFNARPPIPQVGISRPQNYRIQKTRTED